MQDENFIPEWRIIGASVKGASHERSGQANQDAMKWSPESGDGSSLILAIADGHGGAKYFRSDKGARFAVDAAIETLLGFQESLTDFSNSSWLEENVAKSLVNTWRSKAYDDLSNDPLNDEELSKLADKEGSISRVIVESNPILAYGATILVVMITESFITYLQLGDGDILIVSEKGKTSRVIPKNERHFANETSSLCSSNAWFHFQCRLEKISSSSLLPALILISTDGYKDSFSSDEEFHKVGSDLFEMMHSNKLEEIKSNLPNWLLEATHIGSGDDITLGLLYRMDVFKASESIKQEEHLIEEGLELNAQSGHHYGTLQPNQGELWHTS